MATIKSFTDISQSKKLAEILPIESADMWWAERYAGQIVKWEYIVEEKPVYYPVHYGVAANPQGNDVVSIAYSLLGMPYIANSAGPYGFDCSGFVSYVYSCVGTSITRSSYSQQYVGTGVSYADAQPGDILIWGYYDGAPTHSALYVGNGQMIHAANSGTGVIVSDVNFWLNGSGTHILTVRRV